MFKKSKSDIPKYINKYRIESIRLKGYDYSQNGEYFITICTKDKKHYFGEIIDGKMNLSDMGKIVFDEWRKTVKIRNYIELGEWVIMPNHLHGILIINNEYNCAKNKYCRGVLSKRLYKNSKHLRKYNGNHLQMSKISPVKNLISMAIRFFKRQTIIRIRKNYPKFSWQSRFYDRIIRNESEYKRIEKYIYNNPINWRNDKFINFLY